MFEAVATAVLTGLGTAFLYIAGWAVSTNTKVKVLEQDRDSLKELIEEKFSSSDERADIRNDAVNHRLERIERALNGSLRGH